MTMKNLLPQEVSQYLKSQLVWSKWDALKIRLCPLIEG